MLLKVANSIVQSGDPVLRGAARRLTREEIASPSVRRLIEKMRKLLAAEKNGVGLAAPQVGVPVALFIVAGRIFEEHEDEGADVKHTTARRQSERKPEPHPLDKVFINPEIIRASRKQKALSEGCLSVRGAFGTVMRHEKATVRALNERGTSFTYHGADLLAQIFQHEVDHLNGVLFIDNAISIEPESERRGATSRMAGEKRR